MFGIMVQILIEANKGLNKTRIIYNCNLNYNQLLVYLDFLLVNKFLVRQVDVDGQEKFVTTQKGNFFVKEFQQLQILMD